MVVVRQGKSEALVLDNGSAELNHSRENRGTTILVRVISFVAVIFTAWHVFASFLWIFPPSPLRQLVPGNALTSYMLPMFGQSWSVFAPEPINGDYHFNVRALVQEDGDEEVTGWVSATDVELSMVQYNLFPPRAGIQAEELASTFKGSWGELNEEQREVVALDFFEADWEAHLKDELESQGDENDLVDDYLVQDHRATAYATQVAKAIWGDDVVRVQYRVSRQNVLPFIDRNDSEAQRPEPQTVLPGWREPLVEEGQSEQDFADVFRAQYEKLQGSKQ